jgi:hypothetical protein
MVMQAISYRQHIEGFYSKAKPKLIQKSFFLIFGVILLSLGFVSSLVYYQYKKDEPLRVENHYLESVIGSFSQTRQSVNETLQTFQVAGAKIRIVDNLKESTPQAAGYYSYLNDIDSTIAKIESLENNIKFEKAQSRRMPVPDKFKTVTKNLNNFYDTSLSTLSQSKSEQAFARQMLSASGLSFYLPVLADEAMWASRDIKQIKTYYENKKLEANSSLTALAKLTVPPEFKPYYDAQIAYLTLFVETGGKVVDILNQEDDKDPDLATQLEKAYQVLNGAKSQNDQIAQTLLSSRLKVYDQKRNFERFAQLNSNANSLNTELAQLAVDQPEPKTDQVYKAILDTYPKIFAGFTI